MNSRIQLLGEFDRMEGVVELANVRIHTQQKCWPKWVELNGYAFSWTEFERIIDKRYRHSLREYEYTAVDSTILDKLSFVAPLYYEKKTFEHCAR